MIRETIAAIDSLDISEADRARLYYQNAAGLLKLPALSSVAVPR